MIFENKVALEEYAYLKSRSTYLGDYTALCNVIGDILMYVDTRDISLAPHLMHKGIWEENITLAIGRYVKKGMRCIDVGANFGYYSLLMARLGAKVDAFEPNVRMLSLLKRSISINGYSEQITANGLAVSEYLGSTVLYVPHEFQGMGSIVNASDDSYAQACATVNLDYYIPDDNVDFIKCDVEGADILVWRGMQRIWERNPKLVLCIECQGNKQALYDAIAGVKDTKIRVVNGSGSIVPLAREAVISSPVIDMLWVTHA